MAYLNDTMIGRLCFSGWLRDCTPVTPCQAVEALYRLSPQMLKALAPKIKVELRTKGSKASITLLPEETIARLLQLGWINTRQVKLRQSYMDRPGWSVSNAYLRVYSDEARVVRSVRSGDWFEFD